MGFLAIIVGFVVLVVLCMMNVHVMIASFAAAFVVTILAGLPITDSLITVFFTRFGSIVASLFPMFLFGAILAKLYTSSGAAGSVADSICNTMFRAQKPTGADMPWAFITVIIASAILCYGGINAAVALKAIYPIALVFSGARASQALHHGRHMRRSLHLCAQRTGFPAADERRRHGPSARAPIAGS